MTVESVAFQLLSIVEERSDISLQTVPQKADVRAPLEIAGQVLKRHTEAGEHHARHGKHGADECSVLKSDQ